MAAEVKGKNPAARWELRDPGDWLESGGSGGEDVNKTHSPLQLLLSSLLSLPPSLPHSESSPLLLFSIILR